MFVFYKYLWFCKAQWWVLLCFSLYTPVDLFISYFHVAKMKTDISDWNNNGVKLIKLKSDRLEVHLLSLGATIHSVIYPGAEEDLGSREFLLSSESAGGLIMDWSSWSMVVTPARQQSGERRLV